jgi:DUF1009 family protein
MWINPLRDFIASLRGGRTPAPSGSSFHSSAPNGAKVGIIAGGGSLPGQLAAAIQAQGRDCFVLAIKNSADPETLPAGAVWLSLGEAGRAFRLLHEHGVSEVVMAGPVRRPTLRDLRPDWRTARFFGRIGLKALGDDGLLRAVIGEFESEGFKVIGADSILGDILAPLGVWGTARPDEQAAADTRRGIEVGQGLGRLDVGQSVVVQQGIVLGVEAVEGTDALLSRCGGLRREGPGGVLVKLCKPQQDRRIDLPTIGVETVKLAAEAGLRGIAVEAGAALVVDLDAVVKAADRAGLFVMGTELP